MYTKAIIERFKNPTFAGGLRGANGTGKSGNNDCGDVVKIYILVDENDTITNARFKAYGGVATIVACDAACELLIDATLEEALSIQATDILEKADGLPEDKAYAAALAEEAINSAVEDFYKKKERSARKAQE